MTTTTIREPIPGHPRYTITPDARAFGPRGELQPFLVRGIPAISVSAPKKTIYLPVQAALVWHGAPCDDEQLAFIDGDKTNWRAENLAYVTNDRNAWWRSDRLTRLEIEYLAIRRERLGLQLLMQEASPSTGWGAPEHYQPGRHGFTYRHGKAII